MSLGIVQYNFCDFLLHLLFVSKRVSISKIKTDLLESAKTKTGLKWYLLCTLIVDGLIGAHIYLKKAKV